MHRGFLLLGSLDNKIPEEPQNSDNKIRGQAIKNPHESLRGELLIIKVSHLVAVVILISLLCKGYYITIFIISHLIYHYI